MEAVAGGRQGDKCDSGEHQAEATGHHEAGAELGAPSTPEGVNGASRTAI